MARTKTNAKKRSFELRDEDIGTDTECNENNRFSYERANDMTRTKNNGKKRSFVLRDEDIGTDTECNENNRSSYERTNGDEENTEVNIRKRGRGGTFMVSLWGLPKGHPKYKVFTNENGQPMGPNKSKFVEGLGTLARNGYYAPLHYEDWRYVPEDKKDEIVAVVNEKFEFPPGMDHWIKQYVGKRWRNWKTNLKSRHFDVNAPLDFQNEPADSRVVKAQWTKIIKYWKTDAAMGESTRNKKIRKMKTMNHTTGKKNFAQICDDMSKDENVVQPISRVEMFKACNLGKDKKARSIEVANAVKEMEDKSKKLPPGFVDEIAPDDVFAQVMGKERNGRVRMMGAGVTPSDLWGDIPSRGTSYRMAMEFKSALEQSEERYKEQLEFNKTLVADLADIRAFMNQQMRNPLGNTSTVHSSSSVQTHTQTSRPLKVNGYVEVKSIFDSTKTVAKGYVQSLDPTWEVGGYALGKNLCSISIQVAVEPSEELFRPFLDFETIGHATGVAVPWPKQLVFNINEV